MFIIFFGEKKQIKTKIAVIETYSTLTTIWLRVIITSLLSLHNITLKSDKYFNDTTLMYAIVHVQANKYQTYTHNIL